MEPFISMYYGYVMSVPWVGRKGEFRIAFHSHYRTSGCHSRRPWRENAVHPHQQQLTCALYTLQNIHLVAKWLGTLDKKVERYSIGSHDDYRVYMSAEPAPSPDSHIIPQGLLENAIKITNEPPTGMHANLHKALDLFTQVSRTCCSICLDSVFSHNPRLALKLIFPVFRALQTVLSIRKGPLPPTLGWLLNSVV